jgi:dTDP-4-dehydrorhamnose reductase
MYKLKKKILVLGSKGQLGRSFFVLSKKFNDLNFFFIHRKKKNYFNFNILKKLINKSNFDYIINCSAYTNVENAPLNKTKVKKINYQLIKNILSVIKNKKIFLIHFSTDFVYNGKKLGQYLEDDKTIPVNYYGKTKAMADHLILLSKIPSVIFRISWLFSKWNTNFVKKIINNGKNNSYINVINDQRGSPTYAYDLADCIIKIIRFNKFNMINCPEIFHFRNKGITTWYLFTKKIFKIFKIKCRVSPVSYKDYKSKVSRPKNSSLSIFKFEKFFNIRIRRWENSLSHYYNNK